MTTLLLTAGVAVAGLALAVKTIWLYLN